MSESHPEGGDIDTPVSVEGGNTAKLIHDVHISLWAVLGSAYALKRVADLGIVNAMQNEDIQAISFLSALSCIVLFNRWRQRATPHSPTTSQEHSSGEGRLDR